MALMGSVSLPIPTFTGLAPFFLGPLSEPSSSDLEADPECDPVLPVPMAASSSLDNNLNTPNLSPPDDRRLNQELLQSMALDLGQGNLPIVEETVLKFEIRKRGQTDLNK
ncbi:paternally-expressed protein 3 protein-like [Platysternon megacephalum]|uniref:Paternally-expressed protein 3 protein-like n=1 Tax=Platysternon megacephalum TaxID=55544 RepID=A0A4D9ECG7_9SAUR|nr:paternally-expressed protein 3 protein-like [Platysternon megacephalum]